MTFETDLCKLVIWLFQLDNIVTSHGPTQYPIPRYPWGLLQSTTPKAKRLVGRVKIMSERKVIGIGAIVDKNMDTLDDVYCS
jgi:hypothetical protein